MKRKSILTLSVCVLVASLLCRWGDSVNAEVGFSYSTQHIDTNSEFSNGSMSGQPLDIWYAWSNVSKTQTLFYAFTSDEVNPPVKNFLGQHFQVANGTEVFVGTALLLIEVYNDTNGDGIPQANFTSGDSELVYYLEVNSSVSCEPTPIQKIWENEIPHYTWGFQYETIDAFLQHAAGHTGAKVMLDHLSFSFDFYIDQNISYLKTGFDIGNITNIEPMGEDPPISLQNLSLSLLFSTVVHSSKPFAAYVNEEPYNSTTATNPATATDTSQIAIALIKAYEFLFGENYNITNGDGTETYETRSEVAATSSLPPGAHSKLGWTLHHFEDYLNLSEIFPLAEGMGGRVDLDYNVSTLLYRICYPIWDGQPIEHDPTYVAYLFSNVIIPEHPSLLFPLGCLMAALLTAYTHRRKHR